MQSALPQQNPRLPSGCPVPAVFSSTWHLSLHQPVLQLNDDTWAAASGMKTDIRRSLNPERKYSRSDPGTTGSSDFRLIIRGAALERLLKAQSDASWKKITSKYFIIKQESGEISIYRRLNTFPAHCGWRDLHEDRPVYHPSILPAATLLPLVYLLVFISRYKVEVGIKIKAVTKQGAVDFLFYLVGSETHFLSE